MSVQENACITHELQGTNVVITILDERIRDAQRVNQIKDAMLEVVNAHPCTNLIIDLSRVKFIGSVGFLAFLAVRRSTNIVNVVLCNLDENVKELFRICRLIPSESSSNAPFQVATSVPAALEWCDARVD
jgi:anti-anti-sigma factor